MLITRRVTEVPSAIILQFAGTFRVWIIAEQLGLSGILTIVAYAITVARIAPARTPARLRVPSYAVWETVVFVLNVLAFMLIGLQLRPIWNAARRDRARRIFLRRRRRAGCGDPRAHRLGDELQRTLPRVDRDGAASTATGRCAAPTVQGGLVISWCGMRGIVTLAAAFALPENFPYRDLIVLTAFAVVLGSLVIQGLTLRPLILALRLEGRRSGRARSRHAPARSPIAPRWTRSTAIRRRRRKSSGSNIAPC